MLAAGGNAGRGAVPSRPNVLLIVSEDHSPQLGCDGDGAARTPRLDTLAAHGVRFEWAFVPFADCSPSCASFLTGHFPHQNGQIGLCAHRFTRYDASVPGAFSSLKASGDRIGLIGNLHVLHEESFPVDVRAIPDVNFNHRNISDYAAAAAGFFDQSDQPFFASNNFADAHPWDRRKIEVYFFYLNGICRWPEPAV
ncbi:sulfatase-like hydrolase/transferase [Planctomicrobium sp. SH664]|uniref:sulfatase-like hydrolase/transferase n=1 Tax=Planctomicrobium sp. SH664 TaxID=3448125 RepID=UPI003F5BC287